MKTEWMAIRAAVAMVWIAGLASCGGGGGGGDLSGRPNVVFIMVDTLRADHLGCYGYDRETSPVMDALAQRGARFEEAIVPAPYTKASIGSIFTSLYPTVHGAVAFEDRLSPPSPTLAECFRDAGYDTVGYYLNTNVHEVFGFGRGFRVYEHSGQTHLVRRGIDTSRPEELSATLVDDSAVTDSFLEYLDQQDEGEPFFAYLHYVGPHDPYIPPKDAPSFVEGELTETAARFYEDKISTREIAGNTLAAIRHGLLDVDERTREQMVGLYDGEIAFTDGQIGRVVEALKARGALENTILVVTSDHGEEFFEHGGWGHGRTHYREMLRVPLIFAGPGVRPTSHRQTVSGIDVMPTLLDLVSIESPVDVQGRSLAEAMGDAPEALEPMDVFAEGISERAEMTRPFRLMSLRRDEGELILDFHYRRKMFFQFREDPAELDDRYGQEGVPAEKLLEALMRVNNRNVERRGQVAKADIGEDMRAQLAAMGYFGDASGEGQVGVGRLWPPDAERLGFMGDEVGVDTFGEVLDFKAEGFPEDQLLYGFWDPSEHGRWMRQDAGVRLKRSEEATTWFLDGWIDLELHGGEGLVITVEVDGRPAVTHRIETTGLFTIEGPLPKNNTTAKFTRLDIGVNRAFVPARGDGTDLRSLAIVAHRVGLRK